MKAFDELIGSTLWDMALNLSPGEGLRLSYEAEDLVRAKSAWYYQFQKRGLSFEYSIILRGRESTIIIKKKGKTNSSLAPGKVELLSADEASAEDSSDGSVSFPKDVVKLFSGVKDKEEAIVRCQEIRGVPLSLLLSIAQSKGFDISLDDIL